MVRDVFVTSGEPKVTYINRDDDVEGEVIRKLEARRKIVAVSGPSKSGKTVMVKNAIRTVGVSSVWLSGNDLTVIGDFWAAIAGQLNLPVSIENSNSAGSSLDGSVTASVGIPAIESTVTGAVGVTEDKSLSTLASTNLPFLVRETLVQRETCVVIDDFHYAPEEMRKSLARALKTMNDARISIIMIAVPHHVLDLVESERELYMRVVRKRVAHWSVMELARIAFQGFLALNILDEQGRVASHLSDNSVGSPLLMQELCAEICETSGINSRDDLGQIIKPPPSWGEFYTDIADNNGQHPLARALFSGPTQRRSRSDLQLREYNTAVDNYGAVLLGLHRLSPTMEVNEVDLRTAINEIVIDNLPLSRVRWTCRKMDELAADQRDQDDPALEFIETVPRRLVIVDPYLAFFLRWGLPSLGLPALVSMQ